MCADGKDPIETQTESGTSREIPYNEMNPDQKRAFKLRQRQARRADEFKATVEAGDRPLRT